MPNMTDAKKIVSSIISFLKANKQIDLLPEIIDFLKVEAEKIRENNIAIITSAYPLDELQLNDIEKKLDLMFHRKLKVVNEINEKIIGGFVIQVADQIIDLSLENYLEEIKNKLKKDKN